MAVRQNMKFAAQKLAAERWLSENKSHKLILIDADENDSRLVFHVPDTPVSFYIVCSEKLHLWADNDELLSNLQEVIEWITTCGEKTIGEVLERAYTSLKPLIETSSVNAEGDEEFFFEDDEGKNSDDNDNDEDEDEDDGYYALADADVESEEKTKESDSDDGEDSNYFNAQGSQTAVKRLLKDLKVMRKSEGKYGITGKPRGNNLFIWDVKLTDIPKNTKLGKDLQMFAKTYHQEPVISLEMQFPGDFPFSPPFIRVIHPRFKFLTGHVTIGGSICLEMLTKSGWRPTNDIENILVQVRSEILSDPAASLDMSSSKSDYTEKEARDAFRRMVKRYGWDK